MIRKFFIHGRKLYVTLEGFNYGDSYITTCLLYLWLAFFMVISISTLDFQVFYLVHGFIEMTLDEISRLSFVSPEVKSWVHQLWCLPFHSLIILILLELWSHQRLIPYVWLMQEIELLEFKPSCKANSNLTPLESTALKEHTDIVILPFDKGHATVEMSIT